MRLISLLLLLAVLLFFACTRKKKTIGNLTEWLEKYHPGRFEIAITQTRDPIRQLSFKAKKSVLSDKNDPLLQIQVYYDKREPDLALDPESIEPLLKLARQELKDARELFAALRAAGLQKVSAGVYRGEAIVLAFENPTIAQRNQFSQNLVKALANWPAAQNYGLRLYFMEPTAYEQAFKDIVPLVHWVSDGPWQRSKSMLYQSIEKVKDLNPEKINQAWQFNPDSERFGPILDQAEPLAKQWASKHFGKNNLFIIQTQYAVLNQKPGLELSFSMAESEEEDAPILGLVAGDYWFDDDQFHHWRLLKQ
jgi:hypothetical protein